MTIGISQYQLPALTTAPGVSRLRKSPITKATIGWDDIGRIKLNGAERRPIIRASEKFSVAREERNIPRSKREKEVSRVYCCEVGRKLRIKNSETMKGRKVFMMQNPMNTSNSICQ